MPKITIKEQERVRFNSFDATDNVVLVPLMYLDTEDTTSRPVKKIELYERLTDFINDVGSAPKTGDEVDNTYYFICELLNQGLKVLVKRWPLSTASGAGTVIEQFTAAVNGSAATSEAEAVAGIFTGFEDKNLYNIKFITVGALGNGYNFRSILLALAATRGDCIAVLDLPNNYDQAAILSMPSIGEKGLYGTCVWPSCYFNLSNFANSRTEADGLKSIEMPASLAYLAAFGSSIQTNADWFAVSGAIRGVIPDLVAPKFEVGERFMHVLQGDSLPEGGDSPLEVRVNPIMNAGSYGYRIWGNRTASSASTGAVGVQDFRFRDFLNIRVLLCDIKKQIYHAAMRTTFEPNDDITWVNFKKLCNTLLDQMQSGRGITWYSWRKVETDKKATIKAVLSIRPIEAVEYFDITINLTDEEVEFEEESI